jgi:hypothetical protein
MYGYFWVGRRNVSRLFSDSVAWMRVHQLVEEECGKEQAGDFCVSDEAAGTKMKSEDRGLLRSNRGKLRGTESIIAPVLPANSVSK